METNNGERCSICDLPGALLCNRCNREPPAFEKLRTPYVYGGGVAQLVLGAKFHGRERAAQALGHLMWSDDLAREWVLWADALVPVPLGRSRARQRGFNQSVALARTLSRLGGRPVRHLLKRTRDTQAQSKLPLEQRADNLRDAFVAQPNAQRLARILVIDDVVTSTETVRQATRALTKLGGLQTRVLAGARAVD